MKRFLLLVAVCLAPVAMFAQYTRITASNVQSKPGVKLASGRVVLTPTDHLNNPIAVNCGGLVGVTSATGIVVNGAITSPSPFQVCDVATSAPQNFCYRVQIFDSSTGAQIAYYPATGTTDKCGSQPTGNTWSLDSFVPNFAPMAMVQIGPQGPQGGDVGTISGNSGDVLVKTASGGWQAQSKAVIDSADYPTLDAMFNVLGSTPGTIKLRNGTYQLATAETLGPGQHLVAAAPCVLSESSSTPCGVWIQWTGATNTTVLNIHNASGASAEGITVDCANISGCAAYHYDSNNAPGSSVNAFHNVSFVGAHYGFVFGVASTTPDTNGYQADTFELKGFVGYCNPADPTSVGVLVNSANAGQNSVIQQGNVQSCNKVFEGVKSNGLLRLVDFNGGSPTGTSPTMLQFDAGFGPYIAENMESEGAWTYAWHDSSNLATPNNSIILGGQFNCSPTCSATADGNAHILSLSSQSNGVNWSATGSSRVMSVSETHWTASANVGTWGPGGSTVPDFIKSLNFVSATATGSVPSGILAGDLAAVRGANSGVLFLGSDGSAYLSRDSSGNITTSKGLSTGGTNPAMGTSDLSTARSATTGALFMGTDGNCYLYRNGTNLQIQAGCGGVTFGGGSALSRYQRYTPTLSPSSVAANTTAEQCFTSVLTSGDVVVGVSKPTAQAGLGIVGWRASGTSACITFVNTTASPITPTASESYQIEAVQ